MVSYAAWSAPLGGHGLTNNTAFEIEPVSVTTPLVENGFSRTVMNAAYTGSLAALFPNPEGEPVTYDLLEIYPASHGTVELGPNGAFTYTPSSLFTGIDRFWFSINGNIGEYVIAVDPTAEQPIAQPPFTPAVSVRASGRSVNNQAQTLRFVLAVSPAAKPGDVYRLNVRQEAIDCDQNRYYHVSCYDISIGSCG